MYFDVKNDDYYVLGMYDVMFFLEYMVFCGDGVVGLVGG